MMENHDGRAEIYYSDGDAAGHYVTAGVLVRDLTPERAEDFLARCRRAVDVRWAQRRRRAERRKP